MTSSILNHVWGQSPAADRVWSQVSGLRPSLSGERILVPMQAYIDDSYEQDGIYVLAGCIATANSWAEFSKEWERALPKWGIVNKDGRYHFHMVEMNGNEERLKRVPIFISIIEKHVLGFVSVKIDIAELKRAKRRILLPIPNRGWDRVAEIDWGEYSDPFFIACRCLLDMFHIKRKEMTSVLGEEKIDFYFDEQSNKRSILDIWDDYIKNRPDELKIYYGATPRFEHDVDFLPLQAADLMAWWVRKYYKDGVVEKIHTLDFGGYKLPEKREKKHFSLTIEFDEEALVKSLKKTIRLLAPNNIIYDSGRQLFLK